MVWKIQTPISDQHFPSSDEDYRLFVFLAHYPVTNSYNLYYYTDRGNTWGWVGLFQTHYSITRVSYLSF